MSEIKIIAHSDVNTPKQTHCKHKYLSINID